MPTVPTVPVTHDAEGKPQPQTEAGTASIVRRDGFLPVIGPNMPGPQACRIVARMAIANYDARDAMPPACREAYQTVIDACAEFLSAHAAYTWSITVRSKGADRKISIHPSDVLAILSGQRRPTEHQTRRSLIA
jgi:hypothetical protein